MRRVTLVVELDEDEWKAWRWLKDHHSQTEATSPDFGDCTAYGIGMSRRAAHELILDALYGAKETVHE